jgi:hypothetical protein
MFFSLLGPCGPLDLHLPRLQLGFVDDCHFAFSEGAVARIVRANG